MGYYDDLDFGVPSHSRTHFDDEKGTIEVEVPLVAPWWAYGLVLTRPRVRVAELRVFPSVERDEYAALMDDIKVPVDPDNYLARKKLKSRIYYGRWHRSKANLAAMGAGIPGTVLDRVSPGALLAVAQADARYFRTHFGHLKVTKAVADAGHKDDRYYAELSAEYSVIVASGGRDARRPVAAMAERRGWSSEYGRGRISDQVREARRRGMLGGVGHYTGRAGGALTEKASQLLQQQSP